jgi:nitrogen fixation protein FixH
MISYMVYRCMKTPVNLVSEQYYKDELAYQDVIDGTKQANALSSRVELGEAGGAVRVRLPREMQGKAVTGTIFFYCPSDVARDRHVDLRMDGTGLQEIARGVVLNGHYTVKVSWKTAGVNYYTQEPFVVQ